jgi:hypothetical protein
MANPTYLQLVNRVLRRMRENEVVSVNSTPYSKLIGDLVNEAKREVEDAWNWGCLRDTITATTAAGTPAYVLTNAGKQFRVLQVYDDTSNMCLEPMDGKRMTSSLIGPTAAQGQPKFYSFNGEYEGDPIVDMFPVPDGIYAINFNLVIPQASLEADSDQLFVPADPVFFGALMRAIEERGEDGGASAALVQTRYIDALGDAVAQDAARHADETVWYAA